MGPLGIIFSRKRLEDDFSQTANSRDKKIYELFRKAGFYGFTPAEVRYFCSWVLANPNPSVADIAAWIGHQYDKPVRSDQVQKLAKQLKRVV